MKKRLLITYISIVALTLLASLFSFWINGKELLQQQSEEQHLRQAQLLGGLFVEKALTDEAECEEFATAYAKQMDVRITIIRQDGTVLGESEQNASDMQNHKDREEVMKAMEGEATVVVRPSSTLGIDYCYCAVPVEHEEFKGVIRLAVPMETMQALRQEYIKSALMVLTIGLLLVVGVIISFTKRFGEPVDRLEVSFNSVSERLENTMEDLKSKNNQLEAILRSMSSGVLAINGKDEVLFYNEALLSLAGRNGDYLGASVYDLVRSSLVFDVVERVRKSRELCCLEGKSGRMKEHFIRVTGTPLNQDRESSRSVLLIIEDITDVKKLENMRSDFVSNVTHELKTPLTSIKGFVDTLKNGAIQNEMYARRFLDIIDIEAERLYTLIQDILVLSEIESGNDYNIQDCDIDGVVKETLELLKQKADDKGTLELIYEPEPYVKPFACNRDRMKQLLINLVDNAIKNTEEGSVTVQCKSQDDQLFISVRDTGIGIEKEHLNRIFERFYRVDKGRSRKMGGTGLGLSIVKHIVEMYGGDIMITSEVGIGTEFIIRLPYTRE